MSHRLNVGMALTDVTEMLLFFLIQTILRLSSGLASSVRTKVRLPDGKGLPGTKASDDKPSQN